MNSNEHNTIGRKVASSSCGAPSANWAILDCSGAEVGLIEAQYRDANENKPVRARQYVVSGYNVWWFDADAEGWFSVDAHGGTVAALAAAKQYAKGTTAVIRKKWLAAKA